ncbi:hypothetical protein ERX27_09870 [Macrococcus brunensis]|uniref:Type I restriction modification DNA specificity domain-containing protein n=1 Tax=Macrococcus brunensis TaxID=198483 RepID=A0A4R6BB41_9STAP|nr:restriction endonuclease subunit S [Macrococcus brunensis]TDL94174.1 hypothetical protein ERX27_09870 [Macrococcus brunensis]
MKLDELMSIESGTLVSRLQSDSSGKTYYLYDQSSFAEDNGVFMTEKVSHKTIKLNDVSKVQMIHQNDIVVNLASSESSLVSKKHEGYILPYNYCKLNNFRNIEPGYFHYWLNSSIEAASQLKLIHQGATLIKKLSVQQIKEFSITLPSSEKQEEIALLNQSRMKLKYLQDKRHYLLSILIKNKVF